MAEKVHKTEQEWREELSPEQYAVLREGATEAPFTGKYWDCHDDGMYHCAACGAALFSADTKFDSGTGWPSFTRPLESANIRTRTDRLLGFARTEVRSALADSHLGHVFDDGPPPAGLRYCMNSAAMRFIPVGRLEAEGYAQYVPLFRSGTATPPKGRK